MKNKAVYRIMFTIVITALIVVFILNEFMTNPILSIEYSKTSTTTIRSKSKESVHSKELSLKCIKEESFQKLNMYYEYIRKILVVDNMLYMGSNTIVIGIDIPKEKHSMQKQQYIGTCLLKNNDAITIAVSMINSTQGASLIIHSSPMNNSYVLFTRPFLYSKPYRHSYILKITDLKKLLSNGEIRVSWVIWRIGLHKLNVELSINGKEVFINDLELLIEIPSLYSGYGSKSYLDGLEEVAWRIIGYPVFSLLPMLLNFTSEETIQLYKEMIRYMIYYSSPLRSSVSDKPQTPNTIKLYYYERNIAGNCLAYSTASIVLGVAGFNQLVGLAINHKLRHAYSLLIYPSRTYGSIGKIKLRVDIDGDGLPDSGDVLIDTGFYDIGLLENFDELYVFSPRSIGIIVSTINELISSGKTFVYPSYDLMGLEIYDDSWFWIKTYSKILYYPAYLFPGNSSKYIIVSNNAVNAWYKFIEPNYRWGLPSKCISSQSTECILSIDYDLGPPVPPSIWLNILNNISRNSIIGSFTSPSRFVLEKTMLSSMEHLITDKRENIVEKEIEILFKYVSVEKDLYISQLGRTIVLSNVTMICQSVCYGYFSIIFNVSDHVTRTEWNKLKIIVYAGRYMFFPKYYVKIHNGIVVLFFSMREFSLRDPIYIYIDNYRLLIKPFIIKM